MLITLSRAWKQAYPGASVGILAMHHVVNLESHPALDVRKGELEQELRSGLSGCDRAALRALPTLHAYNVYYKQFKKTYHVQSQIESLVHKWKPIPQVATLVEAMFMAELRSMLLTAGHDLEAVHLPLRLDVSDGSERYVRLNGQDQVLKARDMYIADATGVLSSIIYGPDRRTCITQETRHVLFTVYAPPGIEAGAVFQHLEDMQSNVALFAPEAETETLKVYTSSDG